MDIGNVVKLKSGGPIMTVIEVDTSSVTCTWFGKAGGEPQVSGFPTAALELWAE